MASYWTPSLPDALKKIHVFYSSPCQRNHYSHLKMTNLRLWDIRNWPRAIQMGKEWVGTWPVFSKLQSPSFSTIVLSILPTTHILDVHWLSPFALLWCFSNIDFSQFWKLESPRSGSSLTLFLAFRWPSSCCVLTREIISLLSLLQGH